MPKRPNPLATLETRRLLRQQTGRAHSVLTGRGAAGIWAVLRALDIHGQRIGIPANTCYIVLWAVVQSGNHPLLIDVDAGTANISAETLGLLGNASPAAIIPAHMYGLPAPMGEITTWAKEHRVTVIEDAALALGSCAEGRVVGGWGNVSILSFGQGKIADHQVGGALLTDDAVLAKETERLLKTLPEWNEHLRALTNQWHGLYWPLHQYESQNTRLPDLYPRLFEIYGEITAYQVPDSHWRGFPQILADLPRNLAHRRQLAGLYDAGLKGIHSFAPPGVSWWRYPLRVAPDVRDELLASLWENGVHEATRWYPSLRLMSAALASESPQPLTPNTDAFAASIINLPLDFSVTTDDVRQVVTLVQRFFGENG